MLSPSRSSGRAWKVQTAREARAEAVGCARVGRGEDTIIKLSVKSSLWLFGGQEGGQSWNLGNGGPDPSGPQARDKTT